MDATVLAHGHTMLAHYGGAPEALTIALPIVIFAGFLLLERRARRRERAAELDGPPEPAQPVDPSGPDR